jgi:hypothetical protein
MCNGLSGADCQILIDSAAAMQTFESVTFPLIQGVFDAQMGDETVHLSATASGKVVLPPSLLNLTFSMPTSTDQEALIQFYEQLTGDLLMQALSEMGLHLVVDEVTVEAAGTSETLSLEVIFRDGGLYARLPSPVGVDQWFGQTLEMSASDLAQFDLAMQMILDQMRTPEFQQTFAQMSILTGISEELTNLVNKYIITTRGADTEMRGQAVYYFSTEFDAHGLLADPDLPGLLMTAIKATATSLPEADAEALSQINESQIRFLLMTAGMIIKDVTIKYEQWIGTDDLLLSKLNMVVAASIDASLLGGEMSGQTADLNTSLTIELSDINTTTLDAVTIPAEFRPLDDTSDFLVGDASVIEATLTVGQMFSGSLSETDDEQDVYGLELAAGDTVQIEIASEDYPYLDIYGPDGFKVESLDTYYEKSHTLNAATGGTYLIVVQGYWEMDYDLTVSAP